MYYHKFHIKEYKFTKMQNIYRSSGRKNECDESSAVFYWNYAVKCSIKTRRIMNRISQGHLSCRDNN